MPTDKVVLVTGVTSGVGQGVVRSFLREGAKVVGSGRRTERGAEFAASLGDDFTFVAGDVQRVDDCERMVATAVERYGRLDVLVNNAGTAGHPPVAPSHEVTEASWDEVLDTNLRGAFFCSGFAVREMLRQGSGGLVVNIASTVVKLHAPVGMSAYAASKAGLVALTHMMAAEYWKDGIRFHAVILGGADGESRTAVNDALFGAGGTPAAAPVFSPDEVGDAIALLADDRMAVATGTEIAIDRAATSGAIVNRVMRR